jgi:hypothetical protein
MLTKFHRFTAWAAAPPRRRAWRTLCIARETTIVLDAYDDTRPRTAAHGKAGRRLSSLSLAAGAIAAAGLLAAAPDARAQPVTQAPSLTPPEYASVARGAMADFGFGSTAVGYSLLGDVGVQSAGIRTWRDRSWLLQWDRSMAARGGVLGNTHPVADLYGGRAVASVEAGYRWRHAQRWSPYTGANLNGELTLLLHPGTSFDKLNSLNAVDGVGGLTAHIAARLVAGASFLDGGAHSVLLFAFVQETARAPGVVTPGVTFTEVGAGARWDIARRLTVQLEGLAGESPTSTDDGLRSTDGKTELAVSAAVRKLFANGMWVAASSSLARQYDHRVYLDGGATYDTADVPSFNVALAYGVPIRWWEPRARSQP